MAKTNVRSYKRRDGTEVRQHKRGIENKPAFSASDMGKKKKKTSPMNENSTFFKIRKSGTARIPDEVVFNYYDDVLSEDGDGNELKTRSARAKYVNERFESEYGYRIKQVGRQRAMTEWLQGLAIDLDYMNYRIIELAKKWGSIPEDVTEKQEDKVIDNWWSFHAVRLERYIRKYNK